MCVVLPCFWRSEIGLCHAACSPKNLPLSLSLWLAGCHCCVLPCPPLSFERRNSRSVAEEQRSRKESPLSLTVVPQCRKSGVVLRLPLLAVRYFASNTWNGMVNFKTPTATTFFCSASRAPSSPTSSSSSDLQTRQYESE